MNAATGPVGHSCVLVKVELFTSTPLSKCSDQNAVDIKCMLVHSLFVQNIIFLCLSYIPHSHTFKDN